MVKRILGYSRVLLAIVLLTVMILAIFPVPVLAIANPDTPPQVKAVYVYQLANGGLGVLVDYYLDYDFTAPITGTPVPTETATEAYMAVFIDTDGTTQLKAVAPYTFVNSGYGRGLIWIQFTAAEVVAYSLDAIDIGLYRVWLVGNPTLAWAGVPPKTIAIIDSWQTTGDPAVLLALRVLYYADQLEVIWALDLIEATALGSRLTTLGSSYFLNVIPNLMTLAPAVFSSGTTDPSLVNQDYSTSFGATMTDVTGSVFGSPVTLVAGAQSVNVLVIGTFTLGLNKGTIGTIANGVGGIVTGSPVSLVFGSNNVTATNVGTLVVTVNLADTAALKETTIIGTALDLTSVAADFGMSRWMFSTLVWFIVAILICAALYKGVDQAGVYGMGSSNNAGKSALILFDICIIGGGVLGLVHPLVAVGLFIMFGAITGLILFFKNASI